MKRGLAAGCVAPLIIFALIGRSVFAASTDSKTSNLELQVAALSTLQDLEVTSDQLKALKEMAIDTAAKGVKYKGKNVGGYQGALQTLRDALVAGDDDKISDAQDAVDDLRDKNDIDYDIDIPRTDAVRKKAPLATKLLTSSQLAAYMSQHADEVPDATETILDALDACHDAQTDFAALKLEAAEQTALLVAGVDAATTAEVARKVSDLLDQAHAMSEDDFNAKRDDLNGQARQICESADSFDQLRHWMQGEMADLLGNPQFIAAATARLAAMEKASQDKSVQAKEQWREAIDIHHRHHRCPGIRGGDDAGGQANA